MKNVKRTTMGIITISILCNSITTLGNSTITQPVSWGIDNLPKIEMDYVPEPIGLDVIYFNQNEDILNQQEYLAEYQNEYSANEIAILQRIVEAESGGEILLGKKWVVNVILNRVKSGTFPNTIKNVVFAKNQFSPISDGRYYKMVISDDSIEAVDDVINGFDESEGALYFFDLRYIKNQKTLNWINSLTFIKRVGNHWFYK